MKKHSKKRTLITILLVLLMSVGISAGSLGKLYLSRKVAVKSVVNYQRNLERIARRHDGNRSAGTSGYDASVKFVTNTLKREGYQITLQPFKFPFFEELTDPVLQRVTPDPFTYPPNDKRGFLTMTFSGDGDVRGTVHPVDVMIPPGEAPNSSTSGCETQDFEGFPPGSIALIQRGSCSFYQKALNAKNSGAAGVVIFNEGQEGRTDATGGTLGQADIDIPVVFSSYDVGSELAELSHTQTVEVDLIVNVINEERSSENIIAELKRGKGDNVIVIGAHLDSVPSGPGINDNGSGSAAILETAVKLGQSEQRTVNRIRFVFFSAEELGLIGSKFYVKNLTPEERESIMFYLNVDMIGSPNYVRFVYDGDGSDTEIPGPTGSDIIESFLVEAFKKRGLTSEPTVLNGRSDYAPFMDINIPIGGLFTGAGDIKTPEQAEIYGGTAGKPYDPNYHTENDTLSNISVKAEREMLKVLAEAVEAGAMGKLEVPKAPGRNAGMFSHTTGYQREYDGPFLVR